MALSKDDIRSAAERLDQAEKTRKQIRQLSLEHPGITIEDAYAIQKAWVEMKVAAGPHREGPQDRPDLEGDAERAQYRRAGFRHPARRHVLCRWRAGAVRPLHRHPRRGRTRLRDEVAACGTGLHDVRRAQRDRFRGAGAGNPRHADRARRSRRPRRRGRSSTPSPTTRRMPASCSAAGRSARWMPTCAGSARCVSATASSKRPGLRPACSTIPPPSVAWLANKIAPNGLALEAGQVVLAGSFIRPIETRKGDTIQADYGPYGSVSCYFA